MVEWKKLGDLCEIKTGKGITQKDCTEDGIYPVISGGQTPMGMYTYYNREGETVTISRVGAYAGYVSFIKERFYLNDKCFSIIPYNETYLDKKYLYDILKEKEDEIIKLQSEGGVPTINTRKLSAILIPIPSLSEQNRIVGILDTFTDSIENLKQQIAQRRKQYEFYRDQLLDLEGKEGVEMKTLGDVSIRISSGKNKSKSKEGKYPVFGSTGIIAFSDSFIYETPMILVARVGANAGYVHLSYGKYDVTDNTLIIDLREEVDQKYIYYNLVKENINQYAKGGGQPLITASMLKTIIVPVPSLSEQQRIVSILDTFEVSISNLEAQLAQRQKQYEYYRNKLLTFE